MPRACFTFSQARLTKSTVTFVTFRDLTEDEIRDYVAKREPFDKAGGYAIQGLASKFVTRISGCYFNVVGLPIPLLYETLKLCEQRSGVKE